MTTTETTTPTVQLTMADRHRIVADLYAWHDFGDKIMSVTIDADRPVRVQVYAHGIDAGRTLQVARDLLDDPTVKLINWKDGDGNPQIHIHLAGTYRGVQLGVFDVLPDLADRDLIRDLPADRVIDALAGDASREG